MTMKERTSRPPYFCRLLGIRILRKISEKICCKRISVAANNMHSIKNNIEMCSHNESPPLPALVDAQIQTLSLFEENDTPQETWSDIAINLDRIMMVVFSIMNIAFILFFLILPLKQSIVRNMTMNQSWHIDHPELSPND